MLVCPGHFMETLALGLGFGAFILPPALFSHTSSCGGTAKSRHEQQHQKQKNENTPTTFLPPNVEHDSAKNERFSRRPRSRQQSVEIA